MNNKLVSVIIPIYNVEKYFEKCLKSIMEQTYKNLEIILVNDGSKENEEAIIKKYMANDSRIIYIKKAVNEGLFKARVTGVKASHGDYIQFVDSDDYINQDFIRLLLDKAEQENSDMTFARTAICTPKGSETIYAFQNTELYKLPLEGTELKKAYYSQHGYAYIWHTIWNKLYKRGLWEKTLPIFERIDTHLVMTEDIAFSSVLYYFAEKASCTDNAVYFYCKHSEASTNAKSMTIGQYEKQIGNVCLVFDFLRDFFEDKEEWIKKYISEFREYYGRIWYRIAVEMDEPEKTDALVLCRQLTDKTFDSDYYLDENYFCYMEIPYSKKIDEIKKRVYDGTEQVISFDVFDTVVSRPLYDPTDLFSFLDEKFEELCSANISFKTIRIEGEQGCRETLCDPDNEDVTLDEIYSYISDIYSIPKDTANALMEYEKELEIRFNSVKKIGYELYTLALQAGKKVIFTSDMYLPESCIEGILRKNGYDKFEKIYVSSVYKKLKHTSNLFKAVLSDLNISPADILHIGDNINGDINGAEKAGISSVYIPKSLDVFCGRTENNTNTHRISMGKDICGEYRGTKSFEKCLPYGAAAAMSANKFFDNPYIGFNEFTDFNVDPYFAGYYLLGTSLIGQTAWLEKVSETRGLKRIVFTSRDGYLLMEAYKRYLKICNKEKEIIYFYVSRRSMMPWILKDKIDFMNLPIVYQQYCPDSIDELLYFCIDHNNDTEWDHMLTDNGFVNDRKFSSINEYQKFMHLFLQSRYSAAEHEKAQKTVSEYCSCIRDDDGIFDLGYSAAIHKAICAASNKTPVALFMHSDVDKHVMNMRTGGFVIESMMDTVPNISGLMREFFFSDTGGSCVSYENMSVPQIEAEEKSYSNLFPINMMQAGALKMVEDFYSLFRNHLSFMDIRTEEMLLPFESFLCSPKPLDTKMFISSYFEDKVYGKLEKMNVMEFWKSLLISLPSYQECDYMHYFDDLLKKHNKKMVAFFGTGKLCKSIFEANPDIPVDVFLDNNREKSGKEYRGKLIFHPEDYPDLNELYIVVVTAFYKEIEEQLEDLGLNKYDDYINYIELL